jgi:MFS family permease
VSTAATQRVTAAFRSGPLAVRSFRLLTGGQFASTIGDYCYAVALPWLVLSNHGSTVLLGIVLACYGVPRTILMPIGGVLADKIGPRTLMLFADVLRCVMVGVLTFLAARHTASLQTLGPIAALIGVGEGLFLPASFAIMPSLLDAGRLAAGNSLNFTAVQVGSLLGPALGGALVATTGASTAAMGVDAASFAVSALSLALIPRRAVAGSMAARSAQAADSLTGQTDSLTGQTNSLAGQTDSLAGLADSLAGLADAAPASIATAEPAGRPQGMLAYIRGSRAMQVILVTAVVMNMANGGMNEVALPALAHARWGAGAYGALLACVAAGAVIGTLAAARTGRLRAPGYLASLGFIVEGVAISLVPFLGGEAGAAIALLFIGASNGLGNVIFFTVAQRHIPAAILGRVMGVLMMCGTGSFPLSVLVTGVLVRHLGTTPFFPIAGIILTVAVIGGNTNREFRDFAHVPQAS